MLALTCKAAFEAYEQSDCRRLEARVSALEGVIAEGQERELLLAENTVFLLATCDLYAERFVQEV
jgi:hypothetical protein